MWKRYLEAKWRTWGKMESSPTGTIYKMPHGSYFTVQLKNCNQRDNRTYMAKSKGKNKREKY